MTTTPASELMPIHVHVHDDSDDVTIEWDETHPTAIALNLEEWSEDDWLAALDEGMAEMVADIEV